jgi:hypothetical protein
MISDFMQTLLDRMDKFPEEFIDVHIDLSQFSYTRAIEGTRWSGITNSMFYCGGESYQFNMFTEEEQTAYFSKLRGILRRKLEQDICSELVSDQRQMELPFDAPNIPTSILKTA